MRRVPFVRSIGARLMAATALLILVVLAAMVVPWVAAERATVRRLTEDHARHFALAMAGAWSNELTDQNWNQIRIQLQRVLERDERVVYAIVSDESQGGRIVAAAPEELVGHHVPDVVPLEVTEAALAGGEASVTKTFLLREVRFLGDTARGRRGERIVEAAAGIYFGRSRIGVLRVGVSLRAVDEVTLSVAERALFAAVAVLLVGLLGAWLVARRLSRPLGELHQSAERMAAGELGHRAEVRRADELGALAGAFNEMAEDLGESFTKLEATARSFERFVPQKFLSVVAPEGIEKIEVGTHATRTVTILFSDIRGYTRLSEARTDEEMFELLNQFLPQMGAAIEAHGGFVDKFIGDAIMAIFDDEATDGALLAALEMRRRLLGLNQERAEAGLPPIEIGIGIHRGPVVMGTVGYQARMDSTVIGDAVNVASRIEGLTKAVERPVLFTGEVLDALAAPDGFTVAVVDDAHAVRGRAEPVRLYSLGDAATPRLTLV